MDKTSSKSNKAGNTSRELKDTAKEINGIVATLKKEVERLDKIKKSGKELTPQNTAKALDLANKLEEKAKNLSRISGTENTAKEAPTPKNSQTFLD
jgi:hypothetical protein